MPLDALDIPNPNILIFKDLIMGTYPKRSPAETAKRQLDKADAFRCRAVGSINYLRLPPRRQARIEALLGIGSCHQEPRLCDVEARKASLSILSKVLKDYRAEFEESGVTTFHLTFVDDVGLMSDRQPHMRLNALKRKVDKAIRTLGLSAIVFMEIQPLLNWPAGGEGRTLMLHAHAICWGKVSRRGHRERLKKLNRSRSWSNCFNAKPVNSRQLKDFGEVLKIGCYVAKLPHDGKIRVPIGGGEFRFRPTLKGYPDLLALRIVEGLSHYSLYDAVFSVGEGQHLRRAWKRKVVEWHRARLDRPGNGQAFIVPNFWDRFHRAGYWPGYSPYTHD